MNVYMYMYMYMKCQPPTSGEEHYNIVMYMFSDKNVYTCMYSVYSIGQGGDELHVHVGMHVHVYILHVCT